MINAKFRIGRRRKEHCTHVLTFNLVFVHEVKSHPSLQLAL